MLTLNSLPTASVQTSSSVVGQTVVAVGVPTGEVLVMEYDNVPLDEAVDEGELVVAP